MRNFELCYLEQERQNIMVKCLMAKDMLPQYESIYSRHNNLAERSKQVVKNPTTLIEDFSNICTNIIREVCRIMEADPAKRWRMKF